MCDLCELLTSMIGNFLIFSKEPFSFKEMAFPCTVLLSYLSLPCLPLRKKKFRKRITSLCISIIYLSPYFVFL